MSKNVLGKGERNRLPRAVAATGAALLLLAGCSSRADEIKETPTPTAVASSEASSNESLRMFGKAQRLTAQAGKVVLEGVMADINGKRLAERDQAPLRDPSYIYLGPNSTLSLYKGPGGSDDPIISFGRDYDNGLRTWAGYSVTPEQYWKTAKTISDGLTPSKAGDLIQGLASEVPVNVGVQIPGSTKEGSSMFSTDYAVTFPQIVGNTVFTLQGEYTPGEFRDYAGAMLAHAERAAAQSS